MKPIELTAANIEGLEELRAAVLDCAELPDASLAERYEVVTRILLSNAVRLQLDQDTLHLCEFARRVACEAMSLTGRNTGFPGSCWKRRPRDNFPPFFQKAGGGSDLNLTDVRSPERQAHAMANTFASILMNDPALSADASALREFQARHRLWTAADELDVD
jgi:hypothetical protein